MARLAVTIDARYVQPYDLVWHRGQFARIRALLPHGAERFHAATDNVRHATVTGCA